MLEIIVIIFGIVTLIRGKYSLGAGKELVGSRARIVGGILLLHLPISFIGGIILGVLAGINGQEIGFVGPFAISLVSLITVLFLSFFVGKKLYKRQEDEKIAAAQGHDPEMQSIEPTMPQAAPALPVSQSVEVEQQWTDENENTWRTMSDGTTEWWNGTEWQKA